MFLGHFRLQEQPFGVTPDPRFLYMSRAHREALSSLIYGIESERGFLAMIAPPGMGKTTLLFQLLERLRNHARTAFLFNTQCDSKQLLGHLLADLGVDFNGADMVKVHEQLNAILLRSNRDGKRCVFIIDEAQNLDHSVLETVRLLSNFETPSSKLLQIVVAGQPALADTLADPKLLQFRQRIGLLARLRALNGKETAKYVRHRLRVAGYQGEDLFTADALELVARRSEGVPRLINSICFNAMSLAYALDRQQIGAELIEDASRDLNFLTDWTQPSFEAGEDEEEEEDGFIAAPVLMTPRSVPAPAPSEPAMAAPRLATESAPIESAVPEPRRKKRRRRRSRGSNPGIVGTLPKTAATPVAEVMATEFSHATVPDKQTATAEIAEEEAAPGFWRRVAAVMARIEFRAAVVVGSLGALLTLTPAPSHTEAQRQEVGPRPQQVEGRPTEPAGEHAEKSAAEPALSETPRPAVRAQRAQVVEISRSEPQTESAPAVTLLPGDARALTWLAAMKPRVPTLVLPAEMSAVPVRDSAAEQE